MGPHMYVTVGREHASVKLESEMDIKEEMFVLKEFYDSQISELDVNYRYYLDNAILHMKNFISLHELRDKLEDKVKNLKSNFPYLCESEEGEE